MVSQSWTLNKEDSGGGRDMCRLRSSIVRGCPKAQSFQILLSDTLVSGKSTDNANSLLERCSVLIKQINNERNSWLVQLLKLDCLGVSCGFAGFCSDYSSGMCLVDDGRCRIDGRAYRQKLHTTLL